MSIPSFLASTADWMRQVAVQVNPLLNGYPFMPLDADPPAPGPGFTYYNTVTGKVRTWDAVALAWADHY